MTDIIELERLDPTVESVVSRLGRHVGRIKSISAIVTWDDGSSSVYHETKETNRIAYDLLVFQRYAQGFLEDLS